MGKGGGGGLGAGGIDQCIIVKWFTGLPINRSYFMEKRGRKLFSKIVRASKLTRQTTLEVNNAHLDRSRC